MHEHQKQTWIELIENYKNLTLLWDPKHTDYSDQRLRQKAYDKLLKIYKTIDSKATLSHFKKKFDNMRTTYNRERKRMKGCKVEGVIYTPNLWYFKHLSFLDKILETPEESERYFHFNRYDNKIYLETSPLKRKRVDINSSSTPKSQSVKVKPEYYLNIEPIQSSGEENTQNTSPSLPSQLRIKVQSPRIQNTFSLRDVQENKKSQMSPDNRLRDLLQKQENFVGTVSQMLTKEQEDWEVIGKSIGLQLSSLEEKQGTIARKLINDVIFFGSMDKLTVESYINVNEMISDNDEKEHFVYVDSSS